MYDDDDDLADVDCIGFCVVIIIKDYLEHVNGSDEDDIGDNNTRRLITDLIIMWQIVEEFVC